MDILKLRIAINNRYKKFQANYGTEAADNDLEFNNQVVDRFESELDDLDDEYYANDLINEFYIDVK